MDIIGNSNSKDNQFLSSRPLKQINWNIIFAGITVILLGWMMWRIHDRFIPIQEGWMQYYSLLTQRGLLPYKDFYYFTQPIPLFIVQIISKFSDGYMLYRYYGMVERLILALALYYLISKHFSPIATFIGVITSVFLYQSFYIDIFYTYYQTTLLFFLLSLICLQRGTDSRYPWLYDCFVGVFASMAFFTKQSNGLFVSLVLFIILIWYSPGKVIIRRGLFFILGLAIPAIVIFGWLLKKQIFIDYLNQVFGGVSSKGSVLDILFGFWGRNYLILYLSIFILILLILYLLWRTKVLIIKIGSSIAIRQDHYKYFSLIAFPLFLGLGLLIPYDVYLSTLVDSLGYFYQLFWLYFPFYILTIASILLCIIWILRKPYTFSRTLAALILASFAWTYSVGLSNQLELCGNLLGTALVLAYLFDRVETNWKHYWTLFILLSCFVLFICAVRKNRVNYNWWGWTEFGHQENVTSVIPAFNNFNLSSETVEIYDKIYLDILDNTTPNEYIYTYPFMTLFNYVTDRLQPTFSPVHYFDVCPDNIAIMDAETLLENPPKMIIYMEMPALDYQFHEEVFRSGQPSGQRSIDAAVETIVKQYSYIKIDTFMSLGWKWPIYVWLKP